MACPTKFVMIDAGNSFYGPHKEDIIPAPVLLNVIKEGLFFCNFISSVRWQNDIIFRSKQGHRIISSRPSG
jgi:hypothetical protein